MSSEFYQSPLSVRYASDKMKRMFSSDKRYGTWRRLWVSLAKAEKECGLPITEEQIKELEAHIDDIDYEYVRIREQEVRHDVMAHIHAYGKVAPSAAGIIHLGATSCYVTDNADLIIYREALQLIETELKSVMKALSDFAYKYREMPAPGYTHFQPAQPVTVGKRASLWLQDFYMDCSELEFVIRSIPFLGCRGTTGTEASFMDLFRGDEETIDRMNRMIADDFGFERLFDVCGQTYPRKLDSRILSVLSAVAQSAYRMAEDIRLLQHDHQIEEPFEEKQIGSSAMAYKRNPMRCERICSLARFVMVDAMNAPLTASTQWLERSLDDSANRRITVPEAFLACDSVLRLCTNVVSGLKVNEKIIMKKLLEYLPFVATENIMMEAVKKGADRQRVHEIIRTNSMISSEKMKNGEDWDLLKALKEEPELHLDETELDSILEAEKYIGRCGSQVEAFVNKLKPVIGETESESDIRL